MRYLTGLAALALLSWIPASATPAGAGSSESVTADLGDTGSDLVFTPIVPCRIIDTRNGVGGPMLANTVRPFFVAGTAGFPTQGGVIGGCSIPEGASAVAMNIAAVSPSSPGWLKAFAYDEPQPSPPPASVINYAPVPGLSAIANGTIVPICDPTSMVCTYDVLFQVSPAANLHLVVDVTGYFRSFPVDDVQARVTGSCSSGSSIRVVNADGSVTCESDTDTNAATLCANGYYLDGSGSCISTSTLQARVTGSCSPGYSIRVVNSNGTVSCEPDDDTNAATLCANGYFLNGDGTCDPVADVTEVVGGFTSYSQSNTGGGPINRVLNIGTATNRFCALSKVDLADTDSTGEYARCRVYYSSGYWYLEAGLDDPDDDANVYCGATCFTLN